MFVFLNIIYRLVQKVKGIICFYLATGHSEEFHIVLFGCSLQESEVRLHILWVQAVLSGIEILVKSQLISDHWVGLLAGVRSPLTRLTINHVCLAIGGSEKKINVSLVLEF